MRFAFILAEKAHHSISMLCRLLAVTRQGFFAWAKREPSERAQADERLSAQVRMVHAQSRRTYGAPRVHAELREAGVNVSRKRVARLMREQHLRARGKRRFVRTTDSKHDEPIAPNVLKRRFETDAPDRVWVADLTYVPTREGWLYLAVILDLYSRRVVGWSMSTSLEARVVLDALAMAVVARKPEPGLVLHSDRGVQYACAAHREALQASGIVASMSRTGDCWDNAVAESFFSTLKTELVHRADFETHADARQSLFEYIEVFYNRRRRHSSLGYLSPASYEDSRAA